MAPGPVAFGSNELVDSHVGYLREIRMSDEKALLAAIWGSIRTKTLRA